VTEPLDIAADPCEVLLGSRVHEGNLVHELLQTRKNRQIVPEIELMVTSKYRNVLTGCKMDIKYLIV
jgi:hypothetical protein